MLEIVRKSVQSSRSYRPWSVSGLATPFFGAPVADGRGRGRSPTDLRGGFADFTEAVLLTDPLLDTFAEFDTIEIAACFWCCESIAKRRVGGLAFSVPSDGLLHHFPVLAARAASAN